MSSKNSEDPTGRDRPRQGIIGGIPTYDSLAQEEAAHKRNKMILTRLAAFTMTTTVVGDVLLELALNVEHADIPTKIVALSIAGFLGSVTTVVLANHAREEAKAEKVAHDTPDPSFGIDPNKIVDSD